MRLAELVGALSLGTDLGLGQPMEHVLRQTLIALRLAERLGLEESDRVVVYYTGLLAWVGCHVDAYEQAKWFGDDIALKADARLVDRAGPGFVLRHLGAGRPPLERLRLGVAFLGEGRRTTMEMFENHSIAIDGFAARLGLGDEVRAGLDQTFERWDGKGDPHGLRGAELLLTSRLVILADGVEPFQRTGGAEAAIRVARERSGTQFDPGLVELLCDEAPGVFRDLDAATSWDAVIAAEPALEVWLSDAELGDALEAIADFTDLKSPWTLGHSRGVADLAAGAAAGWGLPDAEVVTIRRAALVHDLGRLGVSNAIWDAPRPLSQPEMERVRLHPYLSERILAASPALAPLGAIAVQHHERLDGSGYPGGLSGDSITPAGRILAAADAYHAMSEPRPHREACPPAEAASRLRADAGAGRLDGDAAEAVLRAAGHRAGRRRERPAGLTAREVEVLGLLARGLSNREIAERLVISRKTVGNHLEHIYAKIGATNRATATLFAVRHGLIADAPALAPA